MPYGYCQLHMAICYWLWFLSNDYSPLAMVIGYWLLVICHWLCFLAIDYLPLIWFLAINIYTKAIMAMVIIIHGYWLFLMATNYWLFLMARPIGYLLF